MAKQPKMDGAQNRQGQDTELGERREAEGWGGGGAEEGKRKDRASLGGLALTPSRPQQRRGPS